MGFRPLDQMEGVHAHRGKDRRNVMIHLRAAMRRLRDVGRKRLFPQPLFQG